MAETARDAARGLDGRLEEKYSGFSRRSAKAAGRRTAAHPVRWHAEGREAFQGTWQRRPGNYAAIRFGRLSRGRGSQVGKRIYVLHAFQKKSRKGIETPKRDVELIRQRYREAEELEHENEETERH